jgi:hypothetical protein
LPSRIGKSPCNSGSELMMKRIFWFREMS